MTLRFTGLWRNSEFVKLWTGQTISQLGSRITRDGLPLAAVMALGATPAQMGLLSAIAALPYVVLSLLAGAWVDRMRRRPILIAADIGRALLLATVPLAAALHLLAIEQLYAVTLAAGALTVFFDVAYRSYLPTLVTREHVLDGNSKLTLSESFAEILGPGLAGVLIQWLTAPIAILLDAISFLVSAVSLALIRKPEPSLGQARPAEAGPDLRREIEEGLHVVRQNRILRALIGTSATLSFFGSMIGTLYYLFAIRYIHLDPAHLGIAIAAGGVGSLIGTLLTGPSVARWGLGTTMVGSVLVAGAFCFLTPLAGLATQTESPLLLGMAFLVAGQFFSDLHFTIYEINEVSLRQAIAPDRILGRVTASTGFVVESLRPIGAIAAGALATVMGVESTLTLAAAGITLAALWLFFSPARGLRTHPAPLAIETTIAE